MKNKLFLFTFLILISFKTLGQEKQRLIKGVISDSSGPLPGVSILIKGTVRGVESDFDGKYSISANTDDILVFSFVGMTTKELRVKTSDVMNVVLESGNVLDEVVVTALGISRDKRSLGYATQSVSGDEVSENKATNVTNALSGKIAGVQIKTSSGNIGGSSKVLLRGTSSLSGSNAPLYVVDGTPISNENFNSGAQQLGAGGIDFGDMSQDINPDDVESINVLKGGAATALYGARGGNGVIMITTKKGKFNQGIGVSLNSGITFDKVYILPNYQNEYAGGSSQVLNRFSYDPTRHPANFASFDGHPMIEYGTDESWGPRMDGTLVRHWDSWLVNDPEFGKLRPLTPQPNNVRDFYETGATMNTNLALSGGSETTTFRLSLGYTKQEGIMPNSSLDKKSIAFNASHNLSDKLSASASVNYTRTGVVGRPTTGYDFAGSRNVVTSFNNWFQRQLDINRLRDKYVSATGLPQSWNINSPTNSTPRYWDNPYWILNKNYEEDTRNRVYGNVALTYKFNDYLKLIGTARTDFYDFRVEDRVSNYSLTTPRYQEQVRKGQEDNIEFMLNFDKNLTEDLHMNMSLMTNTRRNTFYNNSAFTNGGLSVPNWFNIGASIDRPTITDYFSSKETNSIAAFGSFGYKDMVYLDWSARNDWSSALPTNNNSYFYPSVSTSFIFSKLINNSSLLSFGKLRAGWAKIKQDTDPYQLSNVFTADATPVGSLPSFSTPNTLNNANLRPESFEEYELGLEVKMLKNRLGFDVTYYDKTSTDLIVPLSVSGTSGYTQAWVNAGKMTNNGIEVALNATPVKTDDFTWNVNLNWSKNNNKVIALAPGIDNYLIGSYGPSVNARIGETYGTMITDGIKYINGKPQVFVDDSGNYLYVRETNKNLGTVMPNFIAGLNNGIRYKNVSLNFLLDMQDGGLIYSISNRFGEYTGQLSSTVGVNDKGNPIRDAVADGGGVRVDGVDANGNAVGGYADAVTYFKHFVTRRERFVHDASYIKLREVTLSYKLPSKFLENTLFNDIKLSLVGRNLWLIHSNTPNIDPEATLGSGNIQGFESGQIPSTRSIGFNLNLKF